MKQKSAQQQDPAKRIIWAIAAIKPSISAGSKEEAQEKERAIEAIIKKEFLGLDTKGKKTLHRKLSLAFHPDTQNTKPYKKSDPEIQTKLDNITHEDKQAAFRISTSIHNGETEEAAWTPPWEERPKETPTNTKKEWVPTWEERTPEELAELARKFQAQQEAARKQWEENQKYWKAWHEQKELEDLTKIILENTPLYDGYEDLFLKGKKELFEELYKKHFDQKQADLEKDPDTSPKILVHLDCERKLLEHIEKIKIPVREGRQATKSENEQQAAFRISTSIHNGENGEAAWTPQWEEGPKETPPQKENTKNKWAPPWEERTPEELAELARKFQAQQEKARKQQEENEKYRKAAHEKGELEDLAKIISEDSFLYWGYKRFFLQGEKELFKTLYKEHFDHELEKDKVDKGCIKLKQAKELAKHIEKLDIAPIEDNWAQKVNTGYATTLCLIYIAIFSTFAIYIQTALFGAVLLGGSTLMNTLFGIVVALVATPTAITVSKIRNRIDSNKLFNLLFFGFIFWAFTLISPTVELLLLGKIIYTASLSYQLMLGFATATVTYNALNVIELAMKKSLPSSMIIKLLLLKDIVREALLVLLFTPAGELLERIIMKNQTLFKMRPSTQQDYIKLYIAQSIDKAIVSILLPIVTIYTCILPYSIGFGSIIYGLGGYLLYFLLYGLFSVVTANTPQINLTRPHARFINFIAEPLNYGFIQKHLDKSAEIASIISSTFDLYRTKMPRARLTAPSAKNNYLNYALFAGTFIIQTIIDLVLLPIFIAAYSICKVVTSTLSNMDKVHKNNPSRTKAFLIITAILCATFASPIQLFVLGYTVMAGSPFINVMFGVMASLASTLFSANAYVLTKTHVKPFVSNAFDASSKTFAKAFSCFSKPAAKHEFKKAL